MSKMSYGKKEEVNGSLERIEDKLKEIEGIINDLRNEMRSNHQESVLRNQLNNNENKSNSIENKTVSTKANKRLPINKWFSNSYISGDKLVKDVLCEMNIKTEEIEKKVEDDNNKKKKKDKKEVLEKRKADTIWKALSKQDKDKFKPLHDEYKTKISEDATKDLEKEDITDDDE